jgi:ABC-type nickel/cobalt efflux system permease component RcnA
MDLFYVFEFFLLDFNLFKTCFFLLLFFSFSNIYLYFTNCFKEGQKTESINLRAQPRSLQQPSSDQQRVLVDDFGLFSDLELRPTAFSASNSTSSTRNVNETKANNLRKLPTNNKQNHSHSHSHSHSHNNHSHSHSHNTQRLVEISRISSILAFKSLIFFYLDTQIITTTTTTTT